MAAAEPRVEQQAITGGLSWGGVPSQVPSFLRKLVVPLLLLVAWQMVIELGIYSRGQLPAPVDVLTASRELYERGKLFDNVGISVQRVAFGFGWGAVIALVFGLAVGVSRSIEDYLSPTLQAIRAVPSLAWVPLLILWLGIGEEPKIVLVAIGAFFPIYTNLVAGIRQIDRKLVEVGRAYGMRGLALVRGVMLPASLPSLFTGLRLGLAQAWLFLVAAELIASSRGLGFLLTDSANLSRVDITVLSILLLALLGKTTDWLLQIVERRILRWTDTFKGTA
jgi:sulfonate transport system permease protein